MPNPTHSLPLPFASPDALDPRSSRKNAPQSGAAESVGQHNEIFSPLSSPLSPNSSPDTPLSYPSPDSSPNVSSHLDREPSARPQSASVLWLCLLFPKLLLETVSNDFSEQALAVAENIGSKNQIHSVSDHGEHNGIQVGMSVNSAYAIYPKLKIIPYDQHVEQQRLQQLADWALGFTSHVSLQTGPSLLLEIGSSVKLFSGLQALIQHIVKQFKHRWQHSFSLAVSPTPNASVLMARSGQSKIITDLSQLRSSLGSITIHSLPISVKKKRQLINIGVYVLRDLWRLPPKALARRFGAPLAYYLSQTIGDCHHVLHYHRPKEDFSARIDLDYESDDLNHIMLAAQQLINQLIVFLIHRDASTTHCRWQLNHYQRTKYILNINTRTATRNQEHLLLLLKERLQPMQLRTRITDIELRVHDIQAFVSHNPDLFSSPQNKLQPGENIEDINHLREQLEARLGRHSVHTIHAVEDHRPEYAFCYNNSSQATPHIHRRRPLWLLDTPLLLKTNKQRPYYHGQLKLHSGPERIESGWWSRHPINRDYYIASNKEAMTLWIYFDLIQQSWYLHGLFA